MKMLTRQAYWTMKDKHFYISCIYMVLSAATKNLRRALCLMPGISHTLPIWDSKLKYSMDSSRQYLLIALINTAEIQLTVALVVAALQRAPHRGKPLKNDSWRPQTSTTPGKCVELIPVLFIFLYAPRRIIIYEFPVISGFFSSNAHRLLQVWGRLASFTSLLVLRAIGETTNKKKLR